MTRMEIWKVFGVYYITRSIKQLYTLLVLKKASMDIQQLFLFLFLLLLLLVLVCVCVCGEKDLEQLYSLLEIRIMEI